MTLLTFDNRVVTAPVKEYASRRPSTAVDLVSLSTDRSNNLGGTVVNRIATGHIMMHCEYS